jgi:hypothetical protein
MQTGRRAAARTGEPPVSQKTDTESITETPHGSVSHTQPTGNGQRAARTRPPGAS